MGAALGKGQREAMAEMQRQQMDRQQRMMMANAMAMQRERLNWLLIGYGMIATGAVISKKKTGSVPAAALGPLFIGPLILGYFADMAYGNKVDRVRLMFEDIINKEDHWFSKVEREKNGPVAVAPIDAKNSTMFGWWFGDSDTKKAEQL